MAISAEIIDPSGAVTPITGQRGHPAGDAQAVRIAAHEDQVTLCREGDDLLVDFESGEQLRLEGFYDGETPLFYLQAQDGSYVPHTVPELENACGVAAGGSGNGLLLAAAGLAGVGSILYSQTRNHAPVFDGGEDRGNVRERADGAADEHKAVLKADGELDFHDKDKNDTHKVTTKLVAVNGPSEEDKAVGRFTAEIVKDKGGSGQVKWHFEVKDSEIDYLGENQTIKQTYEVKVDDGHGGTTTKEVTVTITGRNDAPEAKDITAEAKEDGPAITIKADYTDAARDDTHTFTVDASKTKGHVIVNEDGTFSYDPGHAFDYLKENETATDTFTYTVRDQHGDEDTRTVTVEITDQNDAPEAQDVTAETTEDGPAITIAPDFTDKDKGEVHTFTVDTADAKGTVALNEDGTFAYDPGHAFDYLGENETATDSFTYTVRDEHGGESTSTVTVNIIGKNDAPEAR